MDLEDQSSKMDLDPIESARIRRLEEIRSRDVTKLADEYMKRCKHVEWKWGDKVIIYLNPISTILSALIIWAMVIYCIVEPKEGQESLGLGQAWVTDVWTWLYVGTQDVWAIFIVVLFFSKYANMKLGRDDEKPEYNDASYFTMLFSCGIGIGLFYFGVAEPITHYRASQTRYWAKEVRDNQVAQDAMNLTFFHWGIHGWVVYTIIGLLLGFQCYRRGLPMTMRTIFYPLLGDKIFGIIGDLIDTLCIVCTMFGVCTSLGLGVMQLNAGFQSINPDIPNNTTTQLITIWVITALATLSVISGIKVGIRRLSEICFAIGCLLLLIIFFADKPWYLLNLLVQSIGYYLQWLIQLGFHTDAFTQNGIAPDGKEEPKWMGWWTIFYWGWWISWSPFVGMFIAKISRGRTIRQFITYTLTLPVAYSFIWFSVFGGSAIRWQNIAEKKGITCDMYNETAYPYDTGKYSSKALAVFAEMNSTKYSCLDSTAMWFVFIRSYGDIDMFMAVVSLIAIVLYFITSSDSGSLVIDCISANGNQEPPIIQRIFWALTEGATATGLLVAGGPASLKALQSVSIICGLPFTFVLNWTCVAMWRVVREEAGEIAITDGKWDSSVWDIDTWRKVKTVLISIPCPWIVLTRVRMKLDKKDGFARKVCTNLFYAIPCLLWLVLLISSVKVNGLSYVGWAILIFFFAFAGAVRGDVREEYDVDGNMIEDFFTFMLIYPLACMQISEQALHGSPSKKQSQKVQMENGTKRNLVGAVNNTSFDA